MNDGAILEDGVRIFRHRFFPAAHQDARRVAHEVQRKEIGSSKDTRVIRPHDRIAHPAAKGAARADAILHDNRKTFPALVRQIPKQSAIAAGRVEVAEDPAVANNRRKGLFVVAGGCQFLSDEANGPPPVPTLKALFRIARIQQDPAFAGPSPGCRRNRQSWRYTTRQPRRRPVQDWPPHRCRAER